MSPLICTTRALPGATAKVSRCFCGNGADIGILNAVGAGRASAAVVTTDQSVSTDRAVKALRDSFADLKFSSGRETCGTGRH